MRDAKCTFPGCTNRTPDNETDHLQAWEHGGNTDVSNLAQLCPKHHRLKHHSTWTPDPATTKDPPGWTSPTGRHYNPEHPDTEPTHWPQWLMPTAGQFLDARCSDVRCVVASCIDAGPEDLPPWEPDDDSLIDPDDLSPDVPLWAELLATPLIPSR
jgi:hypothetical protein